MVSTYTFLNNSSGSKFIAIVSETYPLDIILGTMDRITHIVSLNCLWVSWSDGDGSSQELPLVTILDASSEGKHETMQHFGLLLMNLNNGAL